MNSRDFVGVLASNLGVTCPATGQLAPKRSLRTLGAAIAFATLAAGCGSKGGNRTLPSVQLAMDQSLAPVYEDGELELYEVRIGTQLPILAPTPAQAAEVEAQPMEPYGHMPWARLGQVRLQLSWTLTNLDAEPHNVEVLVDPWNEFAKYFPGLQLIDEDEGAYLPNLSGIDYLYAMEGAGSAGSRRHGVYTFDDLDEMARDFATALALRADPPTNPDSMEDPTLRYVNHAFAFQNHSDRDPLVQKWVPAVVPALTGFDIALRTFEPAKVAIEVVAEVVDNGDGRVKTEGKGGALLEAPTEVVTFGSVAP
ncbi:MAG: hypothetical protein ACOY0T_07640 [Myxococcota bacterium]